MALDAALVALDAAAVALDAAAVALVAAAVALAAASVDPASIAAKVSVETTGSPSLSKPRAFVARVALTGSVMSIEVGSVIGAFTARSADSASCWSNIVKASSCSFREAARRSPAVTKSVVRSMARSPTIVIWSSASGVVGTFVPVTTLTLPVPFALIATV